MSRERWTFTFELPEEAGQGDRAGRFVARLLKHLLRVWGVRCAASGESAEVRRLRGIVEGLAARVAAQSELLARAAERRRDGA